MMQIGYRLTDPAICTMTGARADQSAHEPRTEPFLLTISIFAIVSYLQ